MDSGIDLTKALPPRPESNKIHVQVGTKTAEEDMEHGTLEQPNPNSELVQIDPESTLRVSVGASYQNGFGASVAWTNTAKHADSTGMGTRHGYSYSGPPCLRPRS